MAIPNSVHSPFSRARFDYFEYAPSNVTFSEPVAQYFLDVLTDASLRATFPLRFPQLPQLPASGEGAFSDAAAASPTKTRTTNPKSETYQQKQPAFNTLDISRDSIEVLEPEDTEHHTHDLPSAYQETLSSTQDVSKTLAGPTEHPTLLTRGKPDYEATLHSELEISISVRDPPSSSAAQNCNSESKSSLLPEQAAYSNAVGTARSSKGPRPRGPPPQNQALRKRRSELKKTSRTRPAQSSLRKTRKLALRLPPHTSTRTSKAAASARAVKIEPAPFASVTQELLPIASSASTPSTATTPATTPSPMPTTTAPVSVPPRKRHLLLAASASTSDQTPSREHASADLIGAAGKPAPTSSGIGESEAPEGRINGGTTLAKRPNQGRSQRGARRGPCPPTKVLAPPTWPRAVYTKCLNTPK